MRNSAFGFSSRTRIRRGVNRKTNSSRNAVALARAALKIQDSVSLAVWSATRKLELRGDIPVSHMDGYATVQQASVERLALQVATIRSDSPQGHAGGRTGRRDKTAGQS
jgi:hypothetical protein